MYGSKLALCLERGGKYGREDETAALNGILPSFMRRAFYRVGGDGCDIFHLLPDRRGHSV